ncbi:hypothetical protein [Micromonospora okii]|uniref:hypothetical protein n=1 Tax=Micromonospora okii TaxID=1182970 RepID=UPI001E62E4AB|nr:hypothetical protein [Micromonospora okii]
MFVHCLGVLAAVPALPTAAPEAAAAPARPAAAAPTPTPEATPAAPAPPPLVSPSVVVPTRGAPSPVTVAVTPAGTPAPGYQVQVRNTDDRPVATTVRQELPAGTSASWVTPGGRAARSADSTEVTWQLMLPARSTTTLHTALNATAPGRAVTAPACAFASDGNRPYDCATATWSGSPVPAAEATDAPAWQRPPVLLAALAVVLLLTLGGLWWWQRRRRARPGDGAGTGAVATGVDPAARLAGAGPARPSPPRSAAPVPGVRRRRRPPVWLLVGAAFAVLAGVVAAATLTATRRVSAIETDSQPTSGAWVGSSTTGAVGVPLREQALEFTVYRVNCPSTPATPASPSTPSTPATPATPSTPAAPSDPSAQSEPSTPPPAGRQCHATVGVRNLTPQQQTWHGQMQRAYLPGGAWVSTDEPATRLANQGRDVFAQPLAAGTRLVLPLVFTVDGRDRPEQLELRSGVFSAGVRVDVP